MAREVISGMTCLTVTPLSPQRTIQCRNEFLSTLETSVGQLARPQRQ